MKAARLTSFDGPKGVKIEDVEKPSVASGKVLVEVHAAGVNPFDYKVAGGMMKIPLPITLGGDFSGVVSEVGDGVSGFAKGDEVFGQASNFNGGTGSFAEFDLASTGTIARKPQSLDFIQAAAIPLTGASALQALGEHIGLQKDQKILIHGGAGGIGSVAIQIAKHMGAYVITTVSANDVEYAKKLGADEVIDYKTQKFEDMVKDVDAVFDLVGGETYNRSFAIIKPGGVIVTMVGAANEELAKKHNVTEVSQMTKVTADKLNKLRDLIESNVLSEQVEKTFPLDQAAEALSYLQNTPPKGKVVIMIKE